MDLRRLAAAARDLLAFLAEAVGSVALVAWGWWALWGVTGIVEALACGPGGTAFGPQPWDAPLPALWTGIGLAGALLRQGGRALATPTRPGAAEDTTGDGRERAG